MRILVVKLSSLGDILHVLPAVHAVKASTGAAVDWVVHPEFASIVRCFSDVDNVITFPRHAILNNLAGAVRELRKTKYDMVVDLHGLLKSAVVARLAKAKRRIGPSYSREMSWLFYGERAGRMNRDRHAVDQALDTVKYLGFPIPERKFEPELFKLPPSPLADGKFIAFAPVSRWATKNWPAAKFAETAAILAKTHPGYRMLVLGSKADKEVGDEIAKASPMVENLCGRTTIGESLSILSRCDLLVANDTGPVHMAVAVGTKCLVVFGPTRPNWTGPYGDGHEIAMLDLPCQPCMKRKCARGDHACMAGISAGFVAAAASRMLGAADNGEGGK